MHVWGYRVPALMPVLALAGVLFAVVVWRLLRGRLGRDRAAAWAAYAFTASMLVAVTMSPGSGRSWRSACAVVPPLSALTDWPRDDQQLLNILLAVPLGAAAALVAGAAARAAAVAGAVLLCAAVELAQHLLPSLHRACDAVDFVNNTAGVLLGWLLVTTTASLVRAR